MLGKTSSTHSLPTKQHNWRVSPKRLDIIQYFPVVKILTYDLINKDLPVDVIVRIPVHKDSL